MLDQNISPIERLTVSLNVMVRSGLGFCVKVLNFYTYQKKPVALRFHPSTSGQRPGLHKVHDGASCLNQVKLLCFGCGFLFQIGI